MRVVAHNDWDGIVSALYFTGERFSEIAVADYYELPSVVDDRVTLFVEVHDPNLMKSTDVVLDHHTPKLAHVPSQGLRGYLATRDRLLALSRGTDPSNVSAVRSLLNDPERITDEGRALMRYAVEPPEDIVHVSNVIDNPILAESLDELAIVLGHSYLRSRNGLDLIIRNGLKGIRASLGKLKEIGRDILPDVVSLAERLNDRCVIVTDRSRYYLAFGAVIIAQKTRPGRYIYGYYVDRNRVRLTMVSPDRWALEFAESLGGGGRPSLNGWYVAGATVDARILEQLKERGFKVIRIHTLPEEERVGSRKPLVARR